MIGRHCLYSKLKDPFGRGRQPTKQFAALESVLEADLEAIGLLSYYSGARPETADYD